MILFIDKESMFIQLSDDVDVVDVVLFKRLLEIIYKLIGLSNDYLVKDILLKPIKFNKNLELTVMRFPLVNVLV